MIKKTFFPIMQKREQHTHTDSDRAAIKSMTLEFLEKGGKIQKIPTGIGSGNIESEYVQKMKANNPHKKTVGK